MGSLLPVRDGSTNIVFHGRAEHIRVEEPLEEAQAVKQVVVESIDSSEANTKGPNDEMVVRWNMTANCFLPNGWPTMQQQAPPHSPTPRGRKRPWNASQPFDMPEDGPSRTRPAPITAPTSIWEPATSTSPPMQVGSNVASYLATLTIGWQSTFMLGDGPFPITSCIRSWSVGEGARIAQSLG